MFSSNEIFILLPLSFLLVFLNPDSLIDFTVVSVAFSSFHWVMLLWHWLQIICPRLHTAEPPGGNVCIQVVVWEPESEGCRGWRGRCCHVSTAELGCLLEAAAQNVEKWSQRGGPGSRSTRCWSLAARSVAHELAASAPPAAQRSGPAPDPMNQNL